jgi:hypothetical protein
MFIRIKAEKNEINWHYWYHEYNGEIFKLIKMLEDGSAEVDLSKLYDQGKISVKFGWVNPGDFEFVDQNKTTIK